MQTERHALGVIAAAVAPIMTPMDPHPAAPRSSAPQADDQQLLASARRALGIEARAVEALTPRLGPEFASACRICLECRGRVVVTGMGKSGHIAGKIAATLASTGTPAFFLHPAEAGHGDLGMITRLDAVLASVAAILPAMCPDLPMPVTTTRPRHSRQMRNACANCGPSLGVSASTALASMPRARRAEASS